MIDKLLTLTLDLNRYDAATRAKILRLLAKAQKELIAKLSSDNLTEFNRARLNSLLKETKDIIASYYTKIKEESAKALEPIPDIVARNTVKALESKIPASLSASIPTEDNLKAIVTDNIVFGAAASDWWDRQATDTAFRFSSAVRQGLVIGETNQQIVKRVKQMLEISARNARSLVQTSVAAVANNSRQMTFEKNGDVIKGFRWATALDSRVCELCMARADKEWTFDRKPIGHSIPFQVPGLHFNDRCILIAVTKSYAELGFPEIKEPKPGQRASDEGPVSITTTFEDFLSRKTEAEQDDQLGVGRAQMWRDGKITLENLIDGSGRPLTFNQLKEKYA